MSDPIDRLHDFGSSFEGDAMPSSAAEARRRGDQLRRRRTALVAVGSAVAVVAVAVPVFALASGDRGPDNSTPVATGSSETGATASPTLSADNLLADAETRSWEGTAWKTSDTYPGDGQSVYHPCATTSLSGLGATDIQNRTWTLEGTDTGVPQDLLDQAWLTESVAEFPDAQAAQAAYDELAAAMPDCTAFARSSRDYEYQGHTTLALPVEGTGQSFVAVYDPVADPQGGGYTHFLQTGLVVAADRLAVVTSSEAGQDFDPRTMDGMTSLAAERLVTGAAPTSDTTTPPSTTTEEASPSADGPATTAPADFPIDVAGRADVTDGTVDGPGPRATGLYPETICGGALIIPGGGPDPAHDLSYSVSTIEGYDGRTLRVYPTAQDAVDAMQALRDQVGACDRDRVEGGQTDRVWQTYPADTGYEDSLTFGWTYEEKPNVGAPAGSLYTAVRVGNAVLAVQWSGEGGAEYRQKSVPDQVRLVGLITPAMCVFTEAGC